LFHLGCEPEVSYLYSTKSGSKRIFEASKVPMPFGEYDIYNQQHLFESLAQLIVEHLDVQRWVFKIDDDYDGLGIAYCDIVSFLPCYKNVLKEAARFGDKWSHKWAQVTSFFFKFYFRYSFSSFRNIHTRKFSPNYLRFSKNIRFL